MKVVAWPRSSSLSPESALSHFPRRAVLVPVTSGEI